MAFISFGFSRNHSGASSRSRVPICAKAGGKKNLRPTIENREAKFRYELIKKFECGVELLGSEIKSVRSGQMSLKDSYCRVKDGELWMTNVNIAQYHQTSSYFNHEPVRDRRLLLHRKDIQKLKRETDTKGMTIIATKAYFNDRGWLKIEVALAKGKTIGDKRESIKKRDDDRQIHRALKNISY